MAEHTALRTRVSELSKALRGACDYGQLAVVQWIVEHTALRTNVSELSVALKSGDASGDGHLDIVKWLVERSALRTTVGVLSEALNWACYCGQWKVVRYVIDYPAADATSYTNYTGNSLLRSVVWCGVVRTMATHDYTWRARSVQTGACVWR